MTKLLVYLDNCCFNRPYDDQTFLMTYLESEAKLFVQKEIISENIDLVWSFMLHYENKDNPYEERKERIAAWETKAKKIVVSNNEILQKSKQLASLGIKEKDALHLSCAIHVKSDYFITTDKKLLNKNLKEISIINPIEFVRRYNNDN